MSLIVSDSSPLNILVRLGQAEILSKLFSKVYVTPVVALEMSHPKTPPMVRQFMTSPPSWIEIRKPAALLNFTGIDAGEIEAISLAVEIRATLMIDEFDGRAIAKAQGLEIIGAIGVLERAADEKYIPDLNVVHAQIRSLNFHVSDAILNDSLARHLTFKQGQPKP